MEDQAASGAPAAAAGAPASGGAGAATVAPPAPGGTQAAVDAARERLAKTGTMFPEGAAAELEPEPKETPEEKVAREAAEAAETPEEKAAREAADAERAAAHEGETDEERAAREAEEAAAGQPGALDIILESEDGQKVTFTAPDQATFDALTSALEPEADHPELNFSLPGVAERGEQEMVFEAPDQPSLERWRRVINDAAVGRQVRTERRGLDRQMEEIERLEDMVQTDPAGFVLERMPQEGRDEVAMHFLFTPGTLEAINERLVKAGVDAGIQGVLEDPSILRTTRAELERDRYKMREQLRDQSDARRAARQAATRAAQQIEGLIPDHITGEQRDEVFNGALKFVVAQGRRLHVDLSPQDVQVYVRHWLEEQKLPAAPAGNGDGKPPASAAASAAPAAAAVPGKTGKQFTAAAAARRTAAAAAPAGVGAPSARARPEMPKTQDGKSTEAAIAEIRKRGGLRAAMGLR